MTVTKTIRFEAAHMLAGHPGPCRNLHGHSYRVDVAVEGERTDGMVIDFKELKNIAEETICRPFDHAFIYTQGAGGAEGRIAALLEENGLKTAPIPCRPTAENLAVHFTALLSARLPGLKSVRVWETADSCAENIFADE